MEQTNKPHVGAKDFFLYIGTIVGLFWGSISFIQLVTEVINYRFPDAVTGVYNYGYTGTMRYAIASLIIVFPLFIFLSWLNQREIATEPSKKDLWIRKWLLILTLFVAGITMVVDLVMFLNAFLGGELTTRFILKALTVFIVAIAVFGYYIWEIRTTELVSPRRKAFAGGAGVLVLLALVFGFITVGSPATQRMLRFDEQRVTDLQNIQWQIISYWQAKGKLPNGLADLTDSISGFKAPVDPETGKAYDYGVLRDVPQGFSVCGTFSLPSNDYATVLSKPELIPRADLPTTSWTHPKGYTCFSRAIDSQLYPVNPKNSPIPVK